MKPVPVIKDKLYIPKKDVDPNVLKQNYEVLQFDDAICSKCEYFHDRPCSVCAQGCEGFITKLRTWGVKKVKGVQYVYVPVGNAFKIKRLFGIDLSKVKDVRPENKFDYPIKFTGTLRHGEKVNGFPTADQVTITKDYLKYKFGLINAQPRSGKCQVYDTLIVANNKIRKIGDVVGNIPEDITVPVDNIQVFGKEGVNKVSHLFRSKSKTVKIVTEDGFTVEGTPEHRMWVNNGEWKQLKDITTNDFLCLSTQSIPEIPVASFDVCSKIADELEHNSHYILPDNFYDLSVVMGVYKILFLDKDSVSIANKELESILQKCFTLLGNPVGIDSGLVKLNKTESKVSSIIFNDFLSPVFDLTVPKYHDYYANGLISHNTVMSVFCCCKIGVKTIVIAKQEEFLNNFYKTFMSMTNVPKIEKKLGHPIVKVVKDVKEMKNLQVALVTYQKFIRESGDKRIKKYINGRYSFLILDEVHGAAAVSFAKFVNKLVMKYRLGLSATPLRKDGRDCLIKEIVGPIVAKSSAIGMVPIVDITETGVCTTKYKGSGPGNWVYAMKWLYSSAERNKLIVNQVFRDINAGHKCILIPTDHKKHMNLLVEMIRKKAKKLARKGTLLNGESIDWRNFVAGFYSGCNRKDILDKADQGIHRVIVAVRSMVKEGIDIRAPSCIYIQTPMSANPQPVGSPFFYQLANRVCTPYAGKRQPVIRVFIDGLSQSLGCLRSMMTYELFPGLRRGKNGESPRYKMASATCRRVWDIIAQARKNAYKPLDRKQRYEQYAKYNNEYDKQKGTWWNSYKDLS